MRFLFWTSLSFFIIFSTIVARPAQFEGIKPSLKNDVTKFVSRDGSVAYEYQGLGVSFNKQTGVYQIYETPFGFDTRYAQKLTDKDYFTMLADRYNTIVHGVVRI